MPKSNVVRPTQDRVREALFNLLMQVIPGARFLDLFAGSGAVGLEALSRGASAAYFLEQDRTVFATLQKNLTAFHVPTSSAQNVNALQWLGIVSSGIMNILPSTPFKIVFADPPYRWAQENGVAPLARALQDKHILAPGGFFITETERCTEPEPLEGYELVRDRLYGKTRLSVWRQLCKLN